MKDLRGNKMDFAAIDDFRSAEIVLRLCNINQITSFVEYERILYELTDVANKINDYVKCEYAHRLIDDFMCTEEYWEAKKNE